MLNFLPIAMLKKLPIMLMTTAIMPQFVAS